MSKNKNQNRYNDLRPLPSPEAEEIPEVESFELAASEILSKSPETPPAIIPEIVGERLTKIPVVVGKLFGLVKNPETKFGYTFYFILTAHVGDDGEIIEVIKSKDSWFMWEALHKVNRFMEEACIEIMKNRDGEKK